MLRSSCSLNCPQKFLKMRCKVKHSFFVQRWTFLGLSFTDNLADILYSFSPLSTGSAAGDQNSIPSFQVVLSWMIVQCFLETVFNSQILKIFSNELKKKKKTIHSFLPAKMHHSFLCLEWAYAFQGSWWHCSNKIFWGDNDALEWFGFRTALLEQCCGSSLGAFQGSVLTNTCAIFYGKRVHICCLWLLVWVKRWPSSCSV